MALTDAAQASEDLAVYTERQAAALLRTIADGNAGVGGLSLAARGCGVCGAIRFLEGYYLILITRRRRVGTLAGHAVYAVEDTEARARRKCSLAFANPDAPSRAGRRAAAPGREAAAARGGAVRREVRASRGAAAWRSP